MYQEVISDLKVNLNKSVEHFVKELTSVRAGRANPKMLDKVMVDYYGNPTPLNQMANISVPEARMLVINLWDPSMLKEVLTAINNANLGLAPSDDGKIIRLVLPVLTEERRREYVKTAKNLAEDAKIAVRNNRRDSMDMLKAMKKDGEIGEDVLHTAESEVQREIDRVNKQIEDLYKDKEKDILSV